MRYPVLHSLINNLAYNSVNITKSITKFEMGVSKLKSYHELCKR